MPFLPPEDCLVCDNELVRRDHDVECVLSVPANAALLAFLDRPVVAKYLETRKELFKFHLPI